MIEDAIKKADLSGSQMPNGEYACVPIVNDVTDLKREQDAFKGAIEIFSKGFQLGPHMMTIIRMSDYRYVDVNRRFLEAGSFSRVEVIGKTPAEIGVPESEFKQIIELLEVKGSVQNYEGSLIMKDGSKGTVIISAEKIIISDQECILFSYNDITEMKTMQMESIEQLTNNLKLEKALSKSNQTILDIIDNIQDGLVVLDDQWNFTYANKKAEELFPKKREEFLDQVLWEVMIQARKKRGYLQNERGLFIGTLLNDGVPITFERFGLIHQDKWYQVTAYPSQFGLSVSYRDITEQKLSHEKLMKSQKKTVSILESMTDCFFALDKNLQFTYINRAAEIAFGKSRDELLGKKMTEVISVNDTSLRYYQEVMDENKSATFEVMSETYGNKWFEIDVYPIETGLTCYFRDITSRKIANKEFSRLESLNLVGQLAAGIGHEIRNPMTTVRGYLQLMGGNPVYADGKPTFELMISELDRANEIITKFLSLAQTKETEIKSQDLKDILNNLYPLLEADTFTQNKQISFILGEIPNLQLNENEIIQLVLNLTRNGLEAMHEGGCLTIKSYVEDGNVVLAIADEGSGIPPENISKVGTPFFTTKDNGTGLGLAICYRIAESHNAKIEIDSSSRGTTFFISFPISNEEKTLAEDQMRHFVYYDYLTELSNKKKILEEVNLLLENKNEIFALLLVDLDKFKSANDNYGHQAGDNILKTVAVRLKSIIRSTDTIGRTGGDEFIIILRNLEGSGDAEKISAAVGETLSVAYTYKENQLFIGASIGISMFPEHGIDANTLIRKAELAMYKVKCKGGNGNKIYSSEMKEDYLNKSTRTKR